MSTEHNAVASAYIVKGSIGNSGLLGATVVNFALLVTPANKQLSGSVHISSAVQNGNFSGRVTGTLYATGVDHPSQIIVLSGSIYPDGPMPLVLPFEANMAVGGDWLGIGGFNYSNVHVDFAPVHRLAQ